MNSKTITKGNPLETEKISKLIVTFAIPSIISMVVNALYNIVDQIFIGKGVGYLGNGATNVVMPLTVIVIALSLLVGDGAAAYLSLKLGEGNGNAAAKGIGNALSATVLIGIILCIVFNIFLKPLCILFGATEEILPAFCDLSAGQGTGYLRYKRIQDVILSALALVVLSPLLILIALAIVVDDPRGGPIFTQSRCGMGGREFRLYKFRTMCADAEEQLEKLLPYNEMTGPAFKIREDPRITRFGRLLRSTSLDELPQLINILRGDMSIVGPRPPLPREVVKYTPYQRQRLNIQPGLTCFWQIQRGRNELDFDAWMELDLRYIRERNWLLDWKLIFLTVKTIFRRDGV